MTNLGHSHLGVRVALTYLVTRTYFELGIPMGCEGPLPDVITSGTHNRWLSTTQWTIMYQETTVFQ